MTSSGNEVVHRVQRPLLLDTNAYTALMRGQAEPLEAMRAAARLCLNTVVLGELLSGFAAGSREGENRTRLAQFMKLRRVEFWPLSRATADWYARVYLELRRAGTPIPTIDLWIAASAIEHGADLLTPDRHFRSISELRSGWSADDLLV